MLQHLLIFGLGHLANFIIKQNKSFTISGTYRSDNPINNKVNHAIKFELGDELFDLSRYKRIIVNFPPQEKLLEFIKCLLKNTNDSQEVIFVSSTSVFGTGHNDESSTLNGIPHSGPYLLDIEAYLRDKECIIIRPGGLVDAKRNPINFFKRSKHISDIQNHINYIHTEDVARFLLKDSFNDNSYNLVAPIKYTKEKFYKRLLENQLDEFSFEKTDKADRVVSSQRAAVKEFDFLYPDLLNYFLELSDSNK